MSWPRLASSSILCSSTSSHAPLRNRLDRTKALHQALLHRFDEVFEFWDELHGRREQREHSELVQELLLLSLLLTPLEVFLLHGLPLLDLLECVHRALALESLCRHF